MKRVSLVLALLIVTLVPVVASAAQGAASPPSCTHLAVGTTTVEGADGQGYVTILFANVGATCELSGYPAIKFFVAKVDRLIGQDIHRASTVFANPAPRRVILARGRVASVGVTWQDDPQPRQSCPPTLWMNVVLPDPDRANYQPSVNAKPCGRRVWVTPFESGAQPTFIWNASDVIDGPKVALVGGLRYLAVDERTNVTSSPSTDRQDL